VRRGIHAESMFTMKRDFSSRGDLHTMATIPSIG
jgi:hypothetical protein